MRDIAKIAAEVDQSRSRYQIERFVVGQHHTPEMQYVQLVRELNVAVRSLETTELKIEMAMAEADELRETGKRSDEIAAVLKERSVEEMRLGLESTKREIAIMEDMLQHYPRYTRQEIEDKQEQYWQERLVRVAKMQALSGSVGWAYIESLWQADAIGMLETTNPLQDLLEAGAPQLPGPAVDLED